MDLSTLRFETAAPATAPALELLLAAAAARAAASPTARLAAMPLHGRTPGLLEARRGAFNTLAAQSLTDWKEA